jgi:hypothetical protein
MMYRIAKQSAHPVHLYILSTVKRNGRIRNLALEHKPMAIRHSQRSRFVALLPSFRILNYPTLCYNGQVALPDS